MRWHVYTGAYVKSFYGLFVLKLICSIEVFFLKIQRPVHGILFGWMSRVLKISYQEEGQNQTQMIGDNVLTKEGFDMFWRGQVFFFGSTS